MAERVVWEEKMVKLEKFRSEQITNIEGFSKTNLEETLKNQEKTAKDLRDLMARVKGKPLTNIECTPTVDFTSTYNAVISRSNNK